MASQYRIKVYAMRGVRTYWVVDDINFREVPGGANINTLSVGTATAFSVYQTNPASYALPNQAGIYHSNYFTQTDMNNGNVWWRYDFNADMVYVYEYTMRARNDSYWTTDTAITWNLEWFNPRLNMWVIVDSRTNVSWTAQNEIKTFTFEYNYYPPYSGRSNLTFNTNYIFRTTESGVHVYNNSFAPVGFISSGLVYLGFYFNCIWANDDYLYLGTNESGIMRSPMTSISGGVYNNLQLYKNYPDITSDKILDIHGDDDYLCAVTESGVDEINTNTAARYYTTISGASRCFQTTSGIYYLISDTLNAVYNLTSDWTNPDYSYNISTHPSLFNVEVMNDLHVRDGVIYLATNNGIIIIKEERGSEASSDYKRFKEI